MIRGLSLKRASSLPDLHRDWKAFGFGFMKSRWDCRSDYPGAGDSRRPPTVFRFEVAIALTKVRTENALSL